MQQTDPLHQHSVHIRHFPLINCATKNCGSKNWHIGLSKTWANSLRPSPLGVLYWVPKLNSDTQSPFRHSTGGAKHTPKLRIPFLRPSTSLHLRQYSTSQRKTQTTFTGKPCDPTPRSDRYCHQSTHTNCFILPCWPIFLLIPSLEQKMETMNSVGLFSFYFFSFCF
jgi:hypothetical protein